jgi:nucleotide-binding universal stress UspA family protein
MSATGALLAIALAWLFIGVVASIVMGRRGHHPFTWGALGAVLGPLVVPVALQDIRREQDAKSTQIVTRGTPREGVDVLIGVDGSAEAHAAIDAVIDVLGDRLGQCTLASVIDYDTALSDKSGLERDRAMRDLAREASHVLARTGNEPAQVLVPGRPAEALQQHTAEIEAQLLVIGTRGRGASKLVLGSVASAIAHHCDVPTLIVAAKTSKADNAPGP